MDGKTANYCLPIFEYSWLNKSKCKKYLIFRGLGLSRLSRRCILQQPFRLLRVWSPQITLAPMFLDRRRQLPRGRGLLLVHAVDVGVQQLGGGAPGLHHHRHHPLVGGHLLFNPCLRQVITSISISNQQSTLFLIRSAYHAKAARRKGETSTILGIGVPVRVNLSTEVTRL